MEKLLDNKSDVESYKILTAKIDKKWDTHTLGVFLKAMQIIVGYFKNKESYINNLGFNKNDFNRQSPIDIKSIKYNSPGWVELLISTGIMASVLNLIKHYVPNKKEQLENEALKVEIEKQKAFLLDKEIMNLEKLGFSQEHKIEFVKHYCDVLQKAQYLGYYHDEGYLKSINLKESKSK